MIIERARAAIAIANKYLRNACGAFSLATTRQSVSPVRGIDQTRIRRRATDTEKRNPPPGHLAHKMNTIVVVSGKRKKLQKREYSE